MQKIIDRFTVKQEAVPKTLKKWFIAHFIIDMLVAIPLFLFPVASLELLNRNDIDPLATRIIAAALFAIGITSYIGRNASLESYKNMLDLKIIWSGSVVAAILFTVVQNDKFMTVPESLILFLFIFFNIVWISWRLNLTKSS